MATVLTPPSRSTAPAPDAPSRTVRRRRPLPGGRAVVGGFLVALSLVGIFAAYTRATAEPTVRFVVARDDLPFGHVIQARDLTLAPMELAVGSRGRAFTDAQRLIGATLVGPIGRGELVQVSSVLLKRTDTAALEISFAISSSRAVGGSLVGGEAVDVLVTYGTGAEAYTVVVVRGARVIRTDTTGGALADGDTQIITVAVPDRAAALALSHAVTAGEVSLVRTAGTDSTTSGPSTYRTPRPAPVTAAPAG